ncbi:hypothetical protein GP486_005967 [Trichoglossum hirsutum]|uniref:Major facilitator superfamily (MFS) profile domain-containing protein n=1 Tax=Trichoglossum hirsutum TaxID=265104 RepID=A0A9P8L889_9PEZI|nr:hypothetical protein GP486_005967 [Trichoglossum hirsutum]
MNRPPFLVSTKPSTANRSNNTLTSDLRDRNHIYRSRTHDKYEKGLSGSTRASLADPVEDEKDFADWKPGRREWMVIWTLSLTSLVVALDSTTLVSALPWVARAARRCCRPLRERWSGEREREGVRERRRRRKDGEVEDEEEKEEEEEEEEEGDWNYVFRLTKGTIARALHGSTTNAFWAATSYLLASAVLQPFMASLSDIFGRRELLMSSLLLFTAGTILAALAQNFTQLLAGRTVQGIGGGGIMALVQVIFTDIVPLRQRSKYMALVQASWAFGTIAGPLMGGAIAERVSWRWIFYVRLPLLAAGLVMTMLSVRLETKRRSWGQKIRRVDWLGGAVFIPSITSFLVAIMWGGVQYSWGSWQTAVPLTVGALGIGATFLWEKWGAVEPFIRSMVFNERSASAAFGCAFMQGLVLYGQLYYIPFFLESVRGFTATNTGVSLLPITFTMIPASAVVGVMMSRSGHYLWAVWAGWATALLGSGLLIFLNANVETFNWILIFLIVGLGHGLLLSPLNLAAQATCDSRDAAFAAAMFTFMRGLGICIGVAVGGSIFQNAVSMQLSHAGLPLSKARDSAAFVQEIWEMPASSDLHIKYVGAYARAFQTVFEIMAVFTLFGGVISLLIEPKSMDRELDSGHVLRKE